MLQGYDMEIQEYIVKTSSPKIILAKLKSILRTSEIQKTKGESEVKKAAANMGAKVVPDTIPEFDGFKIKQLHIPFNDIPGGDFIDYVNVNDDTLVIVVGDVMGKRWGAWYFAIAYAGYVRSAIRFAINESDDLTASDIVQRVNESVFEDERISDVFVTLSIVILNKKENQINYCGAGDIPLFHFSQGEVNLIKSEGTLLGFTKDGKYEDSYVNLLPNDEILILTDGIVETRDIKGESIGNDRLINFIKESGENSSLDLIKERVMKLTNNNLEDDVTLISIIKL